MKARVKQIYADLDRFIKNYRSNNQNRYIPFKKERLQVTR